MTWVAMQVRPPAGDHQGEVAVAGRRLKACTDHVAEELLDFREKLSVDLGEEHHEGR